MNEYQNHEESGSGIGMLLSGLLIGGLVGGAAALLAAPSSGKMLRRNLKRKANTLIDDGEKYITDAKEYITDAKDKALSLVGMNGKSHGNIHNIKSKNSAKKRTLKKAL